MSAGKKRKRYKVASNDGLVNHRFPIEKNGEVSRSAVCGVPNASDLKDGKEDCRPCLIQTRQQW